MGAQLDNSAIPSKPAKAIASPADYRRALLATRDATETKLASWQLWVKLLRTQYQMPDRTITVAQIAAAGRLASRAAAHLSYESLGRALGRQLQYDHPREAMASAIPSGGWPCHAAKVTSARRALNSSCAVSSQARSNF